MQNYLQKKVKQPKKKTGKPKKKKKLAKNWQTEKNEKTLAKKKLANQKKNKKLAKNWRRKISKKTGKTEIKKKNWEKISKFSTLPPC